MIEYISMSEKDIKHAWFYLLRKYLYISWEVCFVYLYIDILHRMKLKDCDIASWLFDQTLLFLLNEVNFYIMKSDVPCTPISGLKEC